MLEENRKGRQQRNADEILYEYEEYDYVERRHPEYFNFVESNYNDHLNDPDVIASDANEDPLRINMLNDCQVRGPSPACRFTL